MKFLIKISNNEYKYIGCDGESWVNDIFYGNENIFIKYGIILNNYPLSSDEIIKNVNWFLFSKIMFENFNNSNYTFCDIDDNDIIVMSNCYPCPISVILKEGVNILYGNNFKIAKDFVIDDMIYFEKLTNNFDY